ncbi:pentatricopeptide repeat-containing protein At3g61520, mitochondrial-like [Durio zibethinus]|uniref:Pentatricopeptide repeat-containing protein At3g61520, mitochondrial-like n=1 Tax=Durio zibethinus TaxID=66656 RepID=A0A6P5ZYE3_DURZI|nr:pentatricopeptide repeat-containing protein At3g61520, mitochondrial-like [Durio zibethinus]
MNTALPVSKHSKLRRLLKPLPASCLLYRHLCTEPNPQPPPLRLQDKESKVAQAIQLLVETPHQEWSSSQPLQSLLFSSPPPSPLFLFKITRSLPSSFHALNFFKHLQQNLSSQDTQFLSYSFQALLEQTGREPDAASRLSELHQASKEWGVPLTVKAAAFLIRYFGRLEMVDKSVLVFNELVPSLRNTHVRNVLIDVLLRDSRFDYAMNVLDEMLQPISEVPPNEITGDIVFNALVKRGRKGRNLSEEDLIKLVLQFGKHSVFPKTNWLTQLISGLCRSGKSNQAWNVLHELLRLRAPLETPPFNAILTGLGRSGDVKRMNTVMAEMKESGIQPDVVTFGILINQLCKLRRVDEAMKVLNKLGEGSGSDGVTVEADVIIYNTLIDGLCKVGRQEEGLQLMERMKSMKGLAPNTVTYNCLIDGFCKAGEIERGKQLFDQMNEEGVSPNVISLNVLVDGMCRHGRISSALQFFSDMRGKGLKGNAVTYTTLITAFCDVDNMGKAVDLFDQMLTSGCFADAVVYYSLISGFCKAGRMDDASNVLSKLKEAGFRPDIVCYNSLVSGFCKKKKVDKAYEIIKEMEEAGMEPDGVTYNTLIAYFCKAGDFAVACRMMKQMIEAGLVPTIATYGALIHAYCINGKFEEAKKLFKDMSSVSKVSPNTIIYNILIESLCKNNDVNFALSLMNDMEAKGVKPNTNTFNAMFKGLKEKNLLEDAFILMDSMIEHACNPDYITMEILTEWLSAVGESKKLKSFVRGCKVSTSTA